MLRQLVSLKTFNVASLNSSRFLASRGWRARATTAQASAPKYADLSLEQRQQVDAYLDTLLDWNTRMNLTAITERDEAYLRHVDDSLALLPALDSCAQSITDSSTKPLRIIDVGSGAGLPGIILAIARPHWHITLLDSLQKRCTFNKEAIAVAGLENVSVAWARAEDAGQDPALREMHGIAVARAVAEVRVLAELCLPLVAVGGWWVAAKGANPKDEVALAGSAISKLGGELVGVREVDSLAPEGPRTVVLVKKVKATSGKYPRRAGTPKKQPL